MPKPRTGTSRASQAHYLKVVRFPTSSRLQVVLSPISSHLLQFLRAPSNLPRLCRFHGNLRQLLRFQAECWALGTIKAAGVKERWDPARWLPG